MSKQHDITSYNNFKFVVVPSYGASDSSESLKKEIDRHWSVLSAITPNASEARPILMVRSVPTFSVSSGSSDLNLMAHQKYNQIEHDLKELQTQDDDERVDDGTISTARSLVAQMRSRDLAPPELSWLGVEAILMLWAFGDTKLAVTVTDGEFGYIVRKNKQNVQIKSNMNPDSFGLVRIK